RRRLHAGDAREDPGRRAAGDARGAGANAPPAQEPGTRTGAAHLQAGTGSSAVAERFPTIVKCMAPLNYLSISISDVYQRVGVIERTHVSQTDLRPTHPSDPTHYLLLASFPPS